MGRSLCAVRHGSGVTRLTGVVLSRCPLRLHLAQMRRPVAHRCSDFQFRSFAKYVNAYCGMIRDGSRPSLQLSQDRDLLDRLERRPAFDIILGASDPPRSVGHSRWTGVPRASRTDSDHHTPCTPCTSAGSPTPRPCVALDKVGTAGWTACSLRTARGDGHRRSPGTS